MKINDLEKILGVKRSSIFYYEREGLLAPGREDNNYRDYTDEDLRSICARRSPPPAPAGTSYKTHNLPLQNAECYPAAIPQKPTVRYGILYPLVSLP